MNLGLNPGLPDHWRTLYSLGQKKVFYAETKYSERVKRVLPWEEELTLYKRREETDRQTDKRRECQINKKIRV